MRAAWAQLERDRVREVIATLPLHARLVLASVLLLTRLQPHTTTGELYAEYRGLARRVGVEAVTQRRVSDIVNELDMLGVLNARVVSRGRYGKTKLIALAADHATVAEALARDPRLRLILEEEKILATG